MTNRMTDRQSYSFIASQAPKQQAKATAAHPMQWLAHQEHDILAHAQQLMALEQAVHAFLPAPLRAGCRVVHYDQGVLSLGMANTTFASRLRQMTPSLLKALQSKQWAIKHIQLRTQPQQQPNMPNRQTSQPPAWAPTRATVVGADTSPSAKASTPTALTTSRAAAGSAATPAPTASRLSPEAAQAFAQLKKELPNGPLAQAIEQLLAKP